MRRKWQKRWEETKPYAAVTGDKRPKFYGLIEFPYPSGQGLHVGHPRPFTAMDIVTRKKRMEGYNVLYPIGFDAFGLPTENYAIKNHIHPAIVTKQNIANFTKPAENAGLRLRLGPRAWTPPTPAITSGPSGSSCRCSRRAWPIRPPCP